MNVTDLDNELEMFRNKRIHAAEQWRLSKAARPATVRMTTGKLLGLATLAASWTVASVGQVAGKVRAWILGSDGLVGHGSRAGDKA